MTTRRLPVLPTNKILDLLFRNVQHAHSGDLHTTAECHICNEPFLTGRHPERPVILRCGHVLGEGCILKWMSPLSRNGGQNSCPLCRGTLLDLGALEVPMTHTTQSGDSERWSLTHQAWIKTRTFYAIIGFSYAVVLLLFVFLDMMDPKTGSRRSDALYNWLAPNPARPLEFKPNPTNPYHNWRV